MRAVRNEIALVRTILKGKGPTDTALALEKTYGYNPQQAQTLVNKVVRAVAKAPAKKQTVVTEDPWFATARAKYTSYKNKQCPTAVKLRKEYNRRRALVV